MSSQTTNKALIKAFHEIVSKIPKRERVIHSGQIKLIQDFLGDTEDLISNQQGKHWSKKVRKITCRVAIRDGESWEATYAEAAKFVNRSEGYIKHTLQVRDEMPFKIGDDIITISCISRRKY